MAFQDAWILLKPREAEEAVQGGKAPPATVLAAARLNIAGKHACAKKPGKAGSVARRLDVSEVPWIKKSRVGG